MAEERRDRHHGVSRQRTWLPRGRQQLLLRITPLGYVSPSLNLNFVLMNPGATPETDTFYKTTSAKKMRRGDYSKGFHTFGIQWTENYIYFYIDSRIHQILFIGFKKDRTMYELGGFAKISQNETILADPWADSTSTTGSAPFDQKFYLILNVAVGARNGWFL